MKGCLGAEIPMPLAKRPNSKFWYIQFQLNHRTFVRSSRTTDRKAAEQIEVQLRARAHAELYLGQRRSITLGDALDRFVRSKAGTPNHANLVGHQRTILALIGGGRLLEEVTTSDLEDFKRQRLAGGVHVQTIKHGLTVIAGVLHAAKRRGYRVPEVEMPSLSLPKSRTRYLSIEEERRLLSELDPMREARGLPRYEHRSTTLKGMMQDAFDIVVLLLDTGARYGEITGLHWTQIDLPHRSIRLWRSKVQNEGILFMTDRVFEVLARRSRATNAEFVFTNKAGGQRTHSAGSIRKALFRAGLSDCTIHTLRHTHATRLIQNGMNIYEVKHVLGHSDIKTTMRYAHLEATDVSCRARDVMNRVNSISVGAFGQAPSLRTIRSKLSSGAAQSPQRILFAGLADSRSSP
jgi:integrase